MIWIVISMSNWRLRKILSDLTPMESWNEVNTAYNLVWVQEPKSGSIIPWNET